MEAKITAETMEEIAEAVGGSVYYGYSGRGMFGAKCVGVVGRQATAIIEEAAQHGLRGANFDSMGLDMIVYWPSINILRAAGSIDADEAEDGQKFTVDMCGRQVTMRRERHCGPCADCGKEGAWMIEETPATQVADPEQPAKWAWCGVCEIG